MIVHDMPKPEDEFVEQKFREFILLFFRQYRTNMTKRKLRHFLSNIPIGYLINLDFLNSSKLISSDELFEMLGNKKKLLSFLMQEGKNGSGII